MRRYTLIELLVVVAAISVLATLGAVVLRSTHRRPGCRNYGRTKAEIVGLKASIQMYFNDTRTFPRPRTARTTPDAALADAAPALFVALRQPPAQGGGPNAPYFATRSVGVIQPAFLAANRMGSDGRTGVRELTESQSAILPGPQELHVLLDPWGNPYHYREWASVTKTLRDDLRTHPPLRTGFGAPRPLETPLIKQTLDLPHTDTFEVWSNGANGVNEFGDPDSDDVVSWR